MARRGSGRRLAETAARGFAVNPGLIVENAGLRCRGVPREGDPQWALSLTRVQFRYTPGGSPRARPHPARACAPALDAHRRLAPTVQPLRARRDTRTLGWRSSGRQHPRPRRAAAEVRSAPVRRRRAGTWRGRGNGEQRDAVNTFDAQPLAPDSAGPLTDTDTKMAPTIVPITLTGTDGGRTRNTAARAGNRVPSGCGRAAHPSELKDTGGAGGPTAMMSSTTRSCSTGRPASFAAVAFIDRVQRPPVQVVGESTTRLPRRSG